VLFKIDASDFVFDAAADGQRFLFAIPLGNVTPPVTTVLNRTSLAASTDQ
jgi:hypothetical protein